MFFRLFNLFLQLKCVFENYRRTTNSKILINLKNEQITFKVFSMTHP